MSFTWLGQSTSLIQTPSLTILTDPVFSHCTLPPFLGPKRLVTPTWTLSSLPIPDIILVSHNHFDHLEVGVIEYFQKLGSENGPIWYVPLGMRKFMIRLGIFPSLIRESDWWREWTHEFKTSPRPTPTKDLTPPNILPSSSISSAPNSLPSLRGSHQNKREVKIVSVPAQQWSGRGFWDMNSSLWCGYVVIDSLIDESQNDDGKGRVAFFHCGDTGYCEVFKEIGRLYGPLTLSALRKDPFVSFFLTYSHSLLVETIF